ncbi:hypothetical protein GCM10010140_55710 [Streptosporangium pseudovulgare]|uniref:Major facilitator superfamily (MFS) profile domain-containing protein n=1 Tax=Streptosporangium pseudovulgare TaxID=35765 RepID=A0ABQ2R9T5_9ACTN|nr:hypothetical protein GCM10010140_55710 [Streptosporangium pseudovulgare]
MFSVSCRSARKPSARCRASAPRTPQRAGGRFDLLGTLTVTLALTALVWGLTTAREQGWSGGPVLGAFAAATVFGALFVLAERRHPDPLIPPRLLRGGRVAAANTLMALFGSVWIALFFFLPLYQQQVLGQGPLVTGLGQLPLAGAVMLGSAPARRLTARIGTPRALPAALIAEAAGPLWLSRISADGSYLTDVIGPSVMIGLGLSIAFVQLTGLSMDGVAKQDAGTAGGLVNTTRQVGGAVGPAVLATLAGSLTARSSQPSLRALTDGYRAAFVASAAVLILMTLLAAYLTRAARTTERKLATRTVDETVP